MQWPRTSRTTCSPPRSARERVWPDLELDELAEGALAALGMPDEVRAVVRVERAALPTRFGVVDTAVQATVVEAERVRHTQRRPAAVLRVQHEQGVGVRARRDRRVRAEA